MTAHTALQEALNRATAHSRPGHAHQNLASALSVSWARLHALLAADPDIPPRVEAAARGYLTPSTFKPPKRKVQGDRGFVGKQDSRWDMEPYDLRRANRPRYGHRKNV